MYMRNFLAGLLLSASFAGTAADGTPELGKPAPDELVDRWNQDVFPDGEGLPAGKGTAVEGKQVYQRYCLMCHGENGTGGSAEELAGAKHGLTDNPPDKTIGTYWPYATTVFDFVRRAMPLNAPGSLSNDQLYAVTAYLLYLNNLVKENQLLTAESLPKIVMPNRDGFVQEPAEWK